MTEETPAREDERREESNELIEDAFGFSIRSLRLVRDIFVRPDAVIRAALARDRSFYASPFRVWFGLLSLQFFIALLYGGMKEILVASDARQGGKMVEALEKLHRDPDAVFGLFDQIVSIAHIPAAAIGSIPAIFVLKGLASDKSFGFARHLQAHFAFLCAPAAVAVIFLPIVFWRVDMSSYAPALQWLVLAIAFWRGGAGAYHATRVGAVVKSQVYGLAIAVFAMGAVLLAWGGAMVFAVVSTTPTG